jgi:hypothetical protein
MKIQMKNQLMMNKRKKEGKIARNEMMDIDKACSIKNVIMKVI